MTLAHTWAIWNGKVYKIVGAERIAGHLMLVLKDKAGHRYDVAGVYTDTMNIHPNSLVARFGGETIPEA